MDAPRCYLPQPGTRAGVYGRVASSGGRLPPWRRPYEPVDCPDRLIGADHRHSRRPRVITICEPACPLAFPAQSLLRPLVRIIDRFVEPLIDVRIALAAPVVRTMHRFRPQGYPYPTTFAPVSTVGRCLVWTSMPLCGIVGCRGVRHGPREGGWSAHLLRQGAQPLPGLSPLPRGGARVRHPAGKDPQRS
jgi:hypothetical protein